MTQRWTMDEPRAMPAPTTAQDSGDGMTRRVLLNRAGIVGGAVLAAAVLPGSVEAAWPNSMASMPLAQVDPLSASKFALIVDGVEIAAFSGARGMSTEIKPATYVDPVTGGRSTGPRRRPSPSRCRSCSGAA